MSTEMRISLTFKDDERWIYNKVKEHSSPSATIKDILKQYYKDLELRTKATQYKGS